MCLQVLLANNTVLQLLGLESSEVGLFELGQVYCVDKTDKQFGLTD